MTGADVAEGIVHAYQFADVDHRAATHNKGIMNGIDAVVIATGNDRRGVEAGAHAYAEWLLRSPVLASRGITYGELEHPMAVATVGGQHESQRDDLKTWRRCAEMPRCVSQASPNICALKRLDRGDSARSYEPSRALGRARGRRARGGSPVKQSAHRAWPHQARRRSYAAARSS